jgi:hypothetical protein
MCVFHLCFFLCCFPSLFLLFPCVCVCLLALSLLFVCSVLLSVVYSIMNNCNTSSGSSEVGDLSQLAEGLSASEAGVCSIGIIMFFSCFDFCQPSKSSPALSVTSQSSYS